MMTYSNKVPSLLSEQFLHGNDDESIAKSIKLGYPEKEMPPRGAALSDKDIRSMVIYIREQQFLFKRGQIKIEKLPAGIPLDFKLWHETQDKSIEEVSIGGKKETWKKGSVVLTLKEGANDLGALLLKPERFKSK